MFNIEYCFRAKLLFGPWWKTGGSEGTFCCGVVPREGWRCLALPKAPSLECCLMGIKPSPGAQLGLWCWCAQQDGHFPGAAMMPRISTARESGNNRVCHAFGMPDGFSCLNHLPIASCTLGSTSSKGCHSRQPARPISALPEPLCSCSFLSQIKAVRFDR